MAAILRRGKTSLQEDAMKANELLLWLSARRQGSWQQFRAAVEELNSDDDSTAIGTDTPSETQFPLHQKLRLDLERLAHVEFFTRGCDKGWRVTPPTLAAHQGSDGIRAVLCGARSPALRERLLRIGEKVGCESLDLSGIPEVIRLIVPSSSALSDIATQAEISSQVDAPFGILSNLPPCDPPSSSHTLSEYPVGADWNIHEFDSTLLRWQKIDRRQAQAKRYGVLRFVLSFQQPRYFLLWKKAIYEMPRAVALYTLLQRSRRDLLCYDALEQKLTVPAICRPPRLLERALVLCSGLPPVYDETTAKLSYCEVPHDIARFAAQLLRQRLT